MNKPFQFKEFAIYQDRCAMKVGTDGVLLGAWASLENSPHTILDIGTGTGLIALMLAQRSSAATIDAIEINDAAFEQSVENFEASPWADRLFCYHAGLDEYVLEIEESYDLIVSNPPFYTETVGGKIKARDMARQNQSLPFEDLLGAVKKLLAVKGIFCTIIPFKEESKFIALAAKMQLYPQRITHVRGNASAAIKRSLLAFGFTEMSFLPNELTIEHKRHEYTANYRALCRDFYLKM